MLFACYLSMIAIVAKADPGEQSCSASMNAEITIEDGVITLDDGDGGQLIIDQHAHLLVDGKQVPLNSEQEAAVNAYADGIRETVPRIVDIAVRGVQVGLTAVTEVFRGFTGAEENPKLDQAIAAIGEKVKASVRQENGNYYLNAKGLDDADRYTEEVETVLEEVISEAVTGMFTADDSAEEKSFLTRMQEFGDRMEKMESEIERKVEVASAGLEEEAEQLCGQLQALERTQDRLHEVVPQSRRFVLITAG